MENFKPSIRYGLIMGFIGVVVFLLVWALAPDMFASWKWMITNFVLLLLALPIVFQILGARDSKQNFEKFTYSNAFIAAFGVGLMATLVTLVFNLVFYTAIDPGFNERLKDQVIETAVERLEASGMDQASMDLQIEKIEQRFESQAGIVGQIKASVFVLIWYAILALIIAIVYRDKKNNLEMQ